MPENHLKVKRVPHKPIYPKRGTDQQKRSALKKLIVAATILTFLLLLGILPRMKQGKTLAEIRSQVDNVPVSVNAVQPVLAPADEDLDLPSSVQAFKKATIYARTSGYLHQLFVDIGSHVKQGQLLATIESPEVDEQVSESQENVAKDQAAVQQAGANVYKLRAGVQASVAQVSQSRSGYEGAEADLAHAKAKLTESRGAADVAKAKLTQAQRHLQGVEASLAQYKTKEGLADKTYRRWKELAAGGAVSGQDLDESEAAYETSLSAVTEAEASVESAKADVVSATAEVQAREGDVQAATADVESSRQKVRSAQSAIMASQSEVGAARASVQAGTSDQDAERAAVRAAQSSLGRVSVLRSFENVTAPLSGVITARNVDVGSLIGAGSGNNEGASNPESTVTKSGLFGLADTNSLRVQVDVPQAYAASIHVGDTALVVPSQSGNQGVEGKIYDTSGALDATTRTLLVEVRVDNRSGKLIPGMYAEVHFKIHHHQAHLRVAADTLIIDAKAVRVALITFDSKVHFQPVTLGRDLGKEVEVLGGLSPQDRLIENPSDDLIEGEKVAVVPSK
jgi:RND family efflux transporter MFP subunit